MMEGVQLSDILNSSASNINEPGNEFINVEGPEMVTDAPNASEGCVALILQPPKATVEAVIEQKMELEREDPILPDHYYDNGDIPVFKPSMDQFRDFEKFITRINHYGMQVGIVKVIPPPEWSAALPPLDEKIKEIRLKNAIEQQFAGSGGVFRQMNIEKRRVYNLPQWRAVCESTDHQPPARRGEVRLAGHTVGRRKARAKPQQPPRKKAKRGGTKTVSITSDPWIAWSADQIPLEEASAHQGKHCISCSQVPDVPGWINQTTGDILCSTCRIDHNRDTTTSNSQHVADNLPTEEVAQSPFLEQSSNDHPMSSTANNEGSTSPEPFDVMPRTTDNSITDRPSSSLPPPTLKRKRSVSIAAATEKPDQDFKNFDYRISNSSEYTVERCQELERIYWKSLTFNSPMYGADMPGSLFDDRTEVWNVAKLDNLLCRIKKLIPGVNSAYLYLGMWKATFSWHVEDMDLYSINYIHFGAPKQWYSVNQRDSEKFEAVMRSNFPNDHKDCPQFMRHKTFLASPSALESKGIKVNRLIHHEGEFVITFPFGYHSGYNLGYNCAESVNFATEEWLDIGRNARKCNCAEDSVNINVDDIIDAIRGGPIESEYDVALIPPDSIEGEEARKKRKERKNIDNGEKKIPKEKKPRFPCMLCPNDPSREPLLPTESGKFAHRVCAEYIPETWILATEDGHEVVAGAELITPARWNLKCLYCSSTRGAKFQCSVTQCCRAYHATCALAAGVLIETAMDELGFVCSFQCRFHRPRRLAPSFLEQNEDILEFASKLHPGETIQGRIGGADSDVPFIGVVVENCKSERTVVIELANGELFEVAYKWILAPPRRDVRALCAHQSVSGATKQRNKSKKKTKITPEDLTSASTSFQPDPQAPQNPEISSRPAPTFLPVPLPQHAGVSTPPAWTARNPALAQYHQYVWQTQQNSKSTGTEDSFASIMQRLQTTPLQPTSDLRSTPENRSPPVILPPPQFNMGQPPPTLLPAPRKEIPFIPQLPIYPPPMEPLARSSNSDLSAGILFVHSDLGQNQQWRDQFTAQFYRSPSSLKDTVPPKILPRPTAPRSPLEPQESVPSQNLSSQRCNSQEMDWST